MQQPVSIIQQTEDWVAINKPAGTSIHSEQNEGLVAQLKQDWSCEFLAPVHRLDKVTSGCLLLAKHSQAASRLSQCFQQRTVEKYYLALTRGKPSKKQGTIRGDMIAARRGSWRLTQQQSDPAITQFFSYGFEQGLRLAVLKLITGKTHQIRVAMKSLGAPIWGDMRYGQNELNQSADRCYLHCWQMRFMDGDEEVLLECLPESGEHFLADSFIHHEQIIAGPTELSWPRI
ncbi:pseudouridine synthase [Pleionea sp. CnH1-48]|uniref:pseudouridine synthase n=1 Tax=Pleionea sp. CnH1-48 TaxID=2954494 RepID=UPI0020972490|nr:pseudouridine synthase [Pleionea sp. CnH1-48]MCO7224572.1 pseudouridine synthase [Pleionea sp. CnH1-48]